MPPALLYALAECAAGLAIGWAGGHGRVDLVPFIAVRPWALLLFACIVGRRHGTAGLLALLTAGVLLAGLIQAAGLALLAGPARETARALPAAILLAVLVSLVMAGARWAGGRMWPLLGLATGGGLLILPGVPAVLDRLSLGPAEAAPRPDPPSVALWTGLPLMWDEAGVGRTLSGGRVEPASVALLRRQVLLRPVANPDAAPSGTMLLVVQPHATAADLVSLDARIRAGGRAVILIDPDLRWPTDFPPGDPRRPPDDAPLAPLLAHWGLSLDKDGGDPLHMRALRIGGLDYRIRPGAPGRWRSDPPGCARRAANLLVDCSIGAGRAILLADADLLADALWARPGSRGAGRHGRTADNGQALIALIDVLGGRRPDHHEIVRWIDSP